MAETVLGKIVAEARAAFENANATDGATELDKLRVRRETAARQFLELISGLTALDETYYEAPLPTTVRSYPSILVGVYTVPGTSSTEAVVATPYIKTEAAPIVVHKSVVDPATGRQIAQVRRLIDGEPIETEYGFWIEKSDSSVANSATAINHTAFNVVGMYDDPDQKLDFAAVVDELVELQQ